MDFIPFNLGKLRVTQTRKAIFGTVRSLAMTYRCLESDGCRKRIGISTRAHILTGGQKTINRKGLRLTICAGWTACVSSATATGNVNASKAVSDVARTGASIAKNHGVIYIQVEIVGEYLAATTKHLPGREQAIAAAG